MSRVVLCLISFLGFIQFSFGAGVDPSNGLKALNVQIQSTEADLSNFQKQQQSLSAALNQLGATVKSCVDNTDSDSNSCETMQIKHNGVNKDLKLLRTQYARLTNSVNTTQQALDELNKKKSGIAVAVDQRAVEAAKARVAAMNDDVKRSGVSLLEQRLDFSELGREIDKQAIGKYVAAKMGLMLNSKLFCQSMRRCNEPEGKAENKVKPEQLKEIFPGLDRDVFKNTDFWSAANKLRSEGAPVPPAIK